MVKLVGIVGTNSKKSTNRQLLQFIQKKRQRKGLKTSNFSIIVSNLLSNSCESLFQKVLELDFKRALVRGLKGIF